MTNNEYSGILITGGTGSFGKAFLKKIINQFKNFKRIVIYSRDELKQWEIQEEYPSHLYPQLRFFIGDIRDIDRLKLAFEGIDLVIHAAALKQVPAAEYNPIEFIKTNVLGAQNIIQASLDTNVKNVIALSTDKAAAPINLYGASKLCSDKLFIAANNIIGYRDLKFSVVRYGNVMGSRGSVIPFFMRKAIENKNIPITNKDMTRFNISLEEGVDMVLWSINNNLGGEIFIPKIPSYKIIDLAEAIGPSCTKNIVGIRPGEKVHEEMITAADSFYTYDLGKYFAIFPSDNRLVELYKDKNIKLKKTENGFSYNSGDNPEFLSIEEIRDLIRKFIDKKFIPI